MRKSWGEIINLGAKVRTTARLLHNVVFTRVGAVNKSSVYAQLIRPFYPDLSAVHSASFNLLGLGLYTQSTSSITVATNLKKLIMEKS